MKSILRSSDTHRDSVPGFTMAEIMILIIFVLLLLLLIGNAIQEEEGEKKEDPPPVPIEDLIKIHDDWWVIAKKAERHGYEPTPQEISNAIEKASILDSIFETARENEIEPTLKGVSDAMKKTGELKKITDAAEVLGHPPTSEGIIKVLGKGTVHPSCWRSENKPIIFIFEISVHDEYFVVRDENYGLYSGEKYVQPVTHSDIPYGRRMNRDEFSETIGKPFFDWSTKQDPECRFFVIVHDKTAPTAKVLWKRNLTVVEGYFYKLIDE